MPKVKHETPEWQKPEIQSTPVAAPVVVKQAPKRDDGIIHVVQGAATPAHATTASTMPTRTPAPAPASRRTASVAPAPARGGSWDDPFADSSPRKTSGSRSASRDFDADEAAPRRKAVAARRDYDDENVAPAPRRNASAAAARSGGRTRAAADDDSWDDPFDAKRAAKSEKTTSSARRAVTPAAKPAAPARGGKWQDPFTEDAPARPVRGAVAMRDRDAKDDGGGKWQAAAKHSGASATDESGSSSHGGWGMIKKRR
jgi:hypothetical protein